MRIRTSGLFAASALAAALLAAACSSNGGSGSSGAARCQIDWIEQAGTTSFNIYLVDAPITSWVGSNVTLKFTRAPGQEVLGLMYYQYVKSSNGTVSYAARGISSNGSATISSQLTGNESLSPVNQTTSKMVSLSDVGSHMFFDLPSTNQTGAYDGSGGTASFSGFWSSLTNTRPGNVGGLATVTFLGSALTMGDTLRYGVCYPASLAAVSKYEADPNERISAAQEALRSSLGQRLGR